MKTTRTLENDILTVSLEGNLDNLSAPSVAQEIEADIDLANSMIIDMKDLNYISSAGLRVLLSIHKKMSAKGGMTVKNVNSQNLELFEFTGFDKFINIE